MMRLGLHPEWVEDLLVIWSSSDMRGATAGLRHGTVSPMFARMGIGEPVETDDVGGYSDLEVAAIRKALELLRDENEAWWHAVMRAFRPWSGAGLPGEAGEHMRTLMAASARLAELVDKEMGE